MTEELTAVPGFGSRHSTHNRGADGGAEVLCPEESWTQGKSTCPLLKQTGFWSPNWVTHLTATRGAFQSGQIPLRPTPNSWLFPGRSLPPLLGEDIGHQVAIKGWTDRMRL